MQAALNNAVGTARLPQVQVLVEGTYPILSMGLPRVKDELFLQCEAKASQEWVWAWGGGHEHCVAQQHVLPHEPLAPPCA